ncbi:MAG: phosphotransferase [Alphaproteobacteria bacterium]|nr:phosphotransferase [Alphaproteobacteria bacterium]
MPPRCPLLPLDPDDPGARALKRSPDRWRAAALDVARRAGLTPDRFTPYADGGALVARVHADAVVKLVPPAYAGEGAAERWALAALTDADLPVALPALLGHGVDDGWTWLVMRHVPGVTLSSVWDGLDEAARMDLMQAIGALVATVRALPRPAPAPHAPTWPAFLTRQRAGLVARQRQFGLPEPLRDGIEAWVDAAIAAMPPAPDDALLTGEYTPFNLHVAERDGRWQLVGMLDFGDAFAGDARYDLIGPGVFLGAGVPARVTALLDAAGLGDADTLRRPLMALHLLHRFSNLPVQVALPTWRQATSLDALAEALWPSPSR